MSDPNPLRLPWPFRVLTVGAVYCRSFEVCTAHAMHADALRWHLVDKLDLIEAWGIEPRIEKLERRECGQHWRVSR